MEDKDVDLTNSAPDSNYLAHFLPQGYSFLELAFDHMRRPFKFRYSNQDPYFHDVDVQREIEQVAYGPRAQAKHAVHADIYSEALQQNQGYTKEIPCNFSGCRHICQSLAEYEHHYIVAHMHTCRQCRASFASNRLLDIHIGERHDSYFEALSAKQPMYACIVEGCDRYFWNDDSRSQHLSAVHGYPKGFRMHKKKAKKRSTNNPRKQMCRFYKTPTGCRYGDKCKFQHIDNSPRDEAGDIDMAEKELASGIANIQIPDSISFGRRGGRGRWGGRGTRHHASTSQHASVDVPMEDHTEC
eukprot:gb/GECG01002006.1/.p1 GENE.gb/GECG01002006.1/~~gb/GECG01002006.1/.p1  ORF type:complete len:299 (+),score=31.53 gb/GECG01002006.1/:1-897(+)